MVSVVVLSPEGTRKAVTVCASEVQVQFFGDVLDDVPQP